MPKIAPPISTESGRQITEKKSALIQHYLHVQAPEELDELTFERYWQRVKYLLWFQAELSDNKEVQL